MEWLSLLAGLATGFVVLRLLGAAGRNPPLIPFFLAVSASLAAMIVTDLIVDPENRSRSMAIWGFIAPTMLTGAVVLWWVRFRPS